MSLDRARATADEVGPCSCRASECAPSCALCAGPCIATLAGEQDELDTYSAGSRQHYIDTGEYLTIGEADAYSAGHDDADAGSGSLLLLVSAPGLLLVLAFLVKLIAVASVTL